MNPGWIITRDHLSTPEDDWPSAVGTSGPSGYEGETGTDELPIPFKLYDDDGELYYTGRMNEAAMDCFGDGRDPLYGYGMPNAGAVRLDYKEDGSWRTL